MSKISLDEMQGLMASCLDVKDKPALDGESLDVPFTDLGFDSLAVLELATLIQQRYGIHVPDEDIESMTTPRAVLAYVNDRLAVA